MTTFTNSEMVLERIAHALQDGECNLMKFTLNEAKAIVDVELNRLDFDEIKVLMERFACSVEKVAEKTTKYFLGKG